MTTLRHRFILVVVILLALVAGFASGAGYEKRQNAQVADAIITEVVNKDLGKSAAIDFKLFWQVWDKLHDRYVDRGELDTQRLVYGAIAGMVEASGDPYTVFFEPVISKKFQEQVTGSFSGVGMEIGMREGLITVIAPLKDSPSMRAGVLPGDIVLKVDQAETASWSVEEAVDRIRGKRGTVVHLTLLRDGTEGYLELDIVRDTIKIHAVEWRMLDDQIAYLQITSFNANAEAEFTAAARELIAKGATRLILDVRNNPGGLLDSSVNIAGWLMKHDSLVVLERFGDGSTDEIRTSGNGQLAGLPTVVLMNGGSASAAEILAGALHDIRTVELIGEKSFGKGSVQQIEEFYNGSSLKVTIAKWLTPKGVSISETGIAPTIEIKMNPADYEEKGWEFGVVGKDPQLDRAIDTVKKTQ